MNNIDYDYLCHRYEKDSGFSIAKEDTIMDISKNIKEIFVILLEKTPENVDVNAFRAAVSGVEGVSDVHHLHVWSLDGEKTMATMHIRMLGTTSAAECEKAKKHIITIGGEQGIDHITVQIDLDTECCEGNCDL